MEDLMKKIFDKKTKNDNKRKTENIIFLVIILVITLILINKIWKNDSSAETEAETTNQQITEENQSSKSYDTYTEQLENILSTIKGVGNVKVYISYEESSSMVPIYNETTTTSNSGEEDSSGGTRNTVETETKKEVIFAEKSGEKSVVTEKTLTPVVQGAIVTAEGAKEATVKANIISAVEAVTGLTAEKVQVFEMK